MNDIGIKHHELGDWVTQVFKAFIIIQKMNKCMK